MSEPSVELQEAIYASLKADAAVSTLAFDVYDDTRDEANGAPWGTQGGYISFGPEQAIDDSVEGIRGDEVYFQIDVWSNRVGKTHCKELCGAVDAVMRAGFVLQTHALFSVHRVLFTIKPDRKDGVMHGMMQYRCKIERG